MGGGECDLRALACGGGKARRGERPRQASGSLALGLSASSLCLSVTRQLLSALPFSVYMYMCPSVCLWISTRARV